MAQIGLISRWRRGGGGTNDQFNLFPGSSEMPAGKVFFPSKKKKIGQINLGFWSKGSWRAQQPALHYQQGLAVVHSKKKKKKEKKRKKKKGKKKVKSASPA